MNAEPQVEVTVTGVETEPTPVEVTIVNPEPEQASWMTEQFLNLSNTISNGLAEVTNQIMSLAERVTRLETPIVVEPAPEPEPEPVNEPEVIHVVEAEPEVEPIRRRRSVW